MCVKTPSKPRSVEEVAEELKKVAQQYQQLKAEFIAALDRS